METLLYSCDEGVATITLNRPEARNAIGATMTAELDALLQQIARDDSVRVLILTGAGGAFCAGGDVRSMNNATVRNAQTVRAGMRRAHRVVKALYDLDRPVIAAVDGPAFGAGFSLALLADFILVSTRARFCMAFGRIGLVPDYGALYTLPRVVGLQRAKELMMSAREVGATEALDIGLALEVLAPEALMPRAMQMARALSSASPIAMSITKDALNGSLDSDLDSLLKLEAASQAVAGTSDYHKEATRRFVEKQAPQFQWPATPAAKP